MKSWFSSITSNGSGDFYDVSSYSDIEYKDIPNFSPNKVDIASFEPDGQFELSDAVDFRPSVGQLFVILHLVVQVIHLILHQF